MEKEGEMGRPVHVLEGDHKLREKDQRKITPVQIAEQKFKLL